VLTSRVTNATLDVLEALMGPDDELYGLKIAQTSGRKVGSVYPILARLEEAGWVESSWEREDRDDCGSRRRFYRFSPEGLEAARNLLTERRGAVRQRTVSGAPARQPHPVTELALFRRRAR
jgi:PadR family transcriptional regulator, regulatory protein PadR